MARVVVVGAGLAGLSATCHLAGRGHEVVLVDGRDAPGGLAATEQVGGYRFETGPTVLTMPDIVARPFEALGEDLADHLTLEPVDPSYRAGFADGSTLSVRHHPDALEEEVRRVCGADQVDGFRQLCAWVQELYEVERDSFIQRSFDRPTDLLRPLGPALALLRMGGLGRLDRRVGHFVTDERLRRLFTFQSLYAGLAPFDALALYGVISYMDVVRGVFAARGGMHCVPTAMARAAERSGVDVRLGTPVERILLAGDDGGPVRGVRLRDGEVLAADAVVGATDMATAYRRLLPGLTPPWSLRRAEYSPSAVVWHAGVRGPLPEGTSHHNIHFGEAWRSAFEALGAGRRMPDPSLLVSVPTVAGGDAAPPGGHVLYVLEPVPNLDGPIDWEREREVVAGQLADRVGALGYPVEVEADLLVGPLEWEEQGLERGTPFSLSHRFTQTGPFRPRNVERRAPGLVFAGASTVPGVGIPMVLISGELAAARVDEAVGGR